MKNILVAEDDRSLRESLAQAMSRSGCNVQVAQSGKEVLEKQVFDVVVASHKLSGADGLEVLKKARSTNNRTVVIVTGENGSGAAEAMRSGAYDYVLKSLSVWRRSS